MAERRREDTVNFAPGPAQLPLEVGSFGTGACTIYGFACATI